MQPFNMNQQLPSSYKVQWDRFQFVNKKHRLAHALLLIDPRSTNLISFAYQMATELLCLQETKSCGECKSCRLLQAKEHPDLCYLEPEKAGSIIKIEQIRTLQNRVFTSPQLSSKRVVIIYLADKMNIAAANALLKLLEEPPENLTFILIAEQLSTIPVTIISRCQQWRFTNTQNITTNYLSCAENYGDDTEKGVLFNQHTVIIQDLIALMMHQISICALAQKWAVYDFNSLIWLIYLINAQMINNQLNGSSLKKNGAKDLEQLSQYFQPVGLFHQLDELNNITKKLQQNISLNQSLALETLLINFSSQKLI